MAENGEEKLIAVARHIAKTLGHTDTMTDDILQIFSNFDGRLREKLTEKLTEDDPRAFEQTLKSLDKQISKYISFEHPIWNDSTEASSFLDAVDELIAVNRDWAPLGGDKNFVGFIDRAEDLLQQAMFRLEDEFKTLMEIGTESFDLTAAPRGGGGGGGVGQLRDQGSYDDDLDEDDEDGDEFDEDGDDIPVAHPVVDYDIIIDLLPSGTISDLHEIARRMVAAGCGKECSHAFSYSRRGFLEESLSRLGLQRLSIDEVNKMQWSELEDEIEKWVKAINVTMRILFPSERRLCDRVFSGFNSAAELSFMEVCRGSTIQLLTFADAVAIGSRAPERLFKVLDVYDAVRDLMPEFELIFSDEYCVFLKNEAVNIWKRLGEAIRGIFMELENLIRRDPAKAAVPGGGLHPITRYVMNYLRAACRSRITLAQVFEESGSDFRKDTERPLLSSLSLAVEMGWIMELLESNLEAKSKIYKDSALCSIFMMNNGRYIVQKVKDNELGSLLGEDWIRKHNAKVRQYHSNYQRSSWSKVLGALKIDNNSVSPGGAVKIFKEKLKLFNSYFEEICKTQSTWVIFDEQMREELKIAVAGNLSPAYRNFIGRSQSIPDSGMQIERHIKYTPEDIESWINELFRGSAGKK